MNARAQISARGLVRRYGTATAVDGLDLSLHQGEVLGLLGPNGAGKTTTLRMLAGCLAPSAGRVYIGGYDMATAPTQAKAQLGYLPERPPLYPELTVDEYLAFCARLHGVTRRRRGEALAAAKRDCGLSAVGRRLIGNLSKGYQQRVGLAQAILHRPDVVILDEPTAGLDPNQIREIRALIRRLGASHSVILSSHILPEIQATCERVAIIHQGRLVFDQRLDAIEGAATTAAIRAGFQHNPTAAELLAIAGVRQAEYGADGLWLLQCEHGNTAPAAIAAQAAAHGWGLYELHASRRTLEDIFTDLTSGAGRAAEPTGAAA